MSQPAYPCPYCCSEVAVQAVVCAHCGRDLALVRPLAIAVQQLSSDLTELRKSVERLQAPAVPIAQESLVLAESDLPSSGPVNWRAALLLVVLCVVGASLAHAILLFVYDVRPVALRVVTMVLPALVAYVLAPRLRMGVGLHALLSLLTGLLCVASMLAITAWIDEVPWLPRHGSELREVVEYTVAISLAAWTVHALHLRQRERRLRGLRLALAANLRGPDGKLQFADMAVDLKRTVEAMTPVCSGAMALYAGFKAFAGS